MPPSSKKPTAREKRRADKLARMHPPRPEASDAPREKVQILDARAELQVVEQVEGEVHE